MYTRNGELLTEEFVEDDELVFPFDEEPGSDPLERVSRVESHFVQLVSMIGSYRVDLDIAV